MGKYGRPRWLPAHLTTGSEEQGYVEREWKSIGGQVYRIHIPRRGGGSAGVSDDLIWLPNRRLLVFWDSKAGTEFAPPSDVRRLEKQQVEFGALAQAGYRTAFGWGDRDSVRRWLLELTTTGEVPQWLPNR